MEVHQEWEKRVWVGLRSIDEDDVWVIGQFVRINTKRSEEWLSGFLFGRKFEDEKSTGGRLLYYRATPMKGKAD